MKRIKIQIAYVLVLIFICCATATAQPEENGGDPPNNDAPLDGGLSVLLAAGVGYGVKKARDSRKSKKGNYKE